MACDLDTHDWLCSRLADKSGLPVISVGYRLAPEHPAPIQFEDALMACRHVLDLVGAGGQIIVSGDSAGAYLAARCALELNANTKQVIGQILFYPLCDMSDQGDGRVASFAKRIIRRAIGSVQYAALRTFDLSKLPPGLVIVGGALDPVRHSAKAFVEAARSKDVATDITIVPRLFHGALNVPLISKAAEYAVDVGAAAALGFRA